MHACGGEFRLADRDDRTGGSIARRRPAIGPIATGVGEAAAVEDASAGYPGAIGEVDDGAGRDIVEKHEAQRIQVDQFLRVELHEADLARVQILIGREQGNETRVDRLCRQATPGLERRLRAGD